MTWLAELIQNDSVARIILILAVVISSGIYLGKIKIFGLSPTGNHLGFVRWSDAGIFGSVSNPRCYIYKRIRSDTLCVLHWHAGRPRLFFF